MPTNFLNNRQRARLIRTYILQEMYKDSEWRRTRPTITTEMRIARGDEKEQKLSLFRDALANSNITPIADIAECFLATQGITRARERLNQGENQDFNYFCRELLEVEVPLQQVYLARHDGDYTKEASLLSYWNITQADIESFSTTPVTEGNAVRPVGRPPADWDKFREELNILKESMTVLSRNWRTDISRQLREWYINEVNPVATEAPQLETIRDKLKPELDAIEQRLS